MTWFGLEDTIDRNKIDTSHNRPPTTVVVGGDAVRVTHHFCVAISVEVSKINGFLSRKKNTPFE